MDVRAADTSSLAAKRLELEKTRPVTQKDQASMDERLAPKAAAEINRDAKRRKSSSEPKGEDSEIVEQRVDEENGVTDAELTPEQDDQGTVHGEHHILDVKV